MQIHNFYSTCHYKIQIIQKESDLLLDCYLLTPTHTQQKKKYFLNSCFGILQWRLSTFFSTATTSMPLLKKPWRSRQWRWRCTVPFISTSNDVVLLEHQIAKFCLLQGCCWALHDTISLLEYSLGVLLLGLCWAGWRRRKESRGFLIILLFPFFISLFSFFFFLFFFFILFRPYFSWFYHICKTNIIIIIIY